MDTIRLSDVRRAVLDGNVYGLFDRIQAVLTEERSLAFRAGQKDGHADGYREALDHDDSVIARLLRKRYQQGHADGCDTAAGELSQAQHVAAENYDIGHADGCQDGWEVGFGAGYVAGFDHAVVECTPEYNLPDPAQYPTDPLAPPTSYRMAYVPHNTRPKASDYGPVHPFLMEPSINQYKTPGQ